MEVASGAGDEDATTNTAFAVLHALHDAGRFAALGAVGAFSSVHDLFTVSGFGNLCHGI